MILRSAISVSPRHGLGRSPAESTLLCGPTPLSGRRREVADTPIRWSGFLLFSKSSLPYTEHVVPPQVRYDWTLLAPTPNPFSGSVRLEA